MFYSYVFVLQDHVQEIFSTYGTIKAVDMPMNRLHPHLNRGCAYVEFETPEEAQKALKHMDGGTCALHCFHLDRLVQHVLMLENPCADSH